MLQRMRLTLARPRVRFSYSPELRLQPKPQPSVQQGQVRHEAQPAAEVAFGYLMPGPAMLGTSPVKHTALRLAHDTEASTTCDRVVQASA